MKTNIKRPKFLNLFKIRLPVTGITSILHRISGALLFVATPLLIYVFSASIKDPAMFNDIVECLSSPLFKFILTVLAWALVHHIIAGIRFLLTDIHIGTQLTAARATAWVVNILSAISLILIAYGVWS